MKKKCVTESILLWTSINLVNWTRKL